MALGTNNTLTCDGCGFIYEKQTTVEDDVWGNGLRDDALANGWTQGPKPDDFSVTPDLFCVGCSSRGA